MKLQYKRQSIPNPPMFRFTETQHIRIRRMVAAGSLPEDARVSVMRPAQKALWLGSQFAGCLTIFTCAYVILVALTA